LQTDAFRGHGLSLLDEQARLRGLQLMHLPLRFRCRKHLLFPQESPSSTPINLKNHVQNDNYNCETPQSNKGTKAKFTTSCGNACVTNILLARGGSRTARRSMRLNENLLTRYKRPITKENPSYLYKSRLGGFSIQSALCQWPTYYKADFFRLYVHC